jgi:hypothetical protein
VGVAERWVRLNGGRVRLPLALMRLRPAGTRSGPNPEEYRRGNTLGAESRHWRHARVGRRYRLIFRFDSKTRSIIFAEVNDGDIGGGRASNMRPAALRRVKEVMPIRSKSGCQQVRRCRSRRGQKRNPCTHNRHLSLKHSKVATFVSGYFSPGPLDSL